MNKNYNPWYELYGKGNWKWVLPLQLIIFFSIISLFNLEM
jgi:hypothetical protein